MVVSKFGQYVLLQVHDESGQLVFETDSLKIDFDIMHIKGWSRAKISLTNLSPDTIRKLGDANNGNYVSISTALHDSEPSLIADRMYVSNALEEIKIPESIFSMYCYSKLRKLYLEKQIDLQVEAPSLRSMVSRATEAAGFSGEVEYKYFPPDILNYIPPQPHSRLQGSLISVLEVLGGYYKFNVYTEGDKLVFMYKPDDKNVRQTSFYSAAGDIQLATSNMRSNPKIGPATLSVVSNLDPHIKPTAILDISELLTLGTDTNEETLQVAEDYLKDKVSGFSKYQALSVQHKGSNWTGDWVTQVAGTSPTVGTSMPSNKWWL